MSQPNKDVYRHELLPTHFLERAGDAYADRIAVVDGEVEYTWRDFPRAHVVLRPRFKLKDSRKATGSRFLR